MKILFLTHRMPFPPNRGDKIRSFHILRHLAQRHDVSLASVVDDGADLRHVPQLGAFVREFAYARIWPRMRKVLLLAEILRSRPVSLSYFYSRGLQRRVDAMIEAEDFDAFLCFSSPMAEYLFRSRHWGARIRRGVRVMDLIDVDSFKWQQYAERSPPGKAWVFRREAEALAAYERRIAAEFDWVLLVSEQEKSVFPQQGAVRGLTAMSNGVDLEYFSPPSGAMPENTGPNLVFTGVMDYWPNVEGVTWFVEQVMPRVRAKVPELRLFIVGSRPAKQVQRLSRSAGVVVTGHVDDVRDYLRGASACVAPLRIARGIQNKVLEAMAMGKAVVSTPQAAEGIQVTPGVDILVAETAGDFSDALIGLLRDPVGAARLGGAARSRVESSYSWERNLALLDTLLQPAGGPRAGAAT